MYKDAKGCIDCRVSAFFAFSPFRKEMPWKEGCLTIFDSVRPFFFCTRCLLKAVSNMNFVCKKNKIVSRTIQSGPARLPSGNHIVDN